MAAIPAEVHARPLPAVTIGEAAARIHRWWRSTREGLHLGFAARSILGRVIEEGAGASHGYDPRVAPWMSPADEEIDRLVARMPDELREALVLDMKRDLPMKVICAKIHCSPADFNRRKEHALGFVAGALTASR